MMLTFRAVEYRLADSVSDRSQKFNTLSDLPFISSFFQIAFMVVYNDGKGKQLFPMKKNHHIIELKEVRHLAL